MSSSSPLSNFLSSSSFLQRNIYRNQLSLNQSLERLSSGLRINHASDDPVGITLANQTQTRLMGNRQAIGNNQKAIQLTDIAVDGAQSVLTNLQRLRELTLNSISDTSSSEDRSRIQTEANALIKDIDRLSKSTVFNKRNLIDGSSAGFRLFERASSEILSNFTYASETTGNTFDFLTGNIQVDPNIDVNDTILFRTSINSSTNKYTLEVRSARQGAIAYYDDLDASPTTFSFSLPTASGTGVGTVTIDRAPYDFERLTGPLTPAELAKPLEQLVNNDRLDPISYGTLNLGLGPNTVTVDINGSMSLQDVLNTLNGLSSGPNVVSASYDTGTGLISLSYTGQAQNSTSTTAAYTIPDPAAAGGPYPNFAAMVPPAQGPAYRSISLPATGFSISSPPANFPALPVALNTSVSYTGSNATITSVFGLASAGNLGAISAYTSEFYGETVETATPSEYVNRTRVVISDVTAQQNSNGSNTGLNTSDTTKTFQVLNTAKVTAPSLSAGSFSIDFGANGVFSFAVNPATTTIQNIVDGINGFNPGNVSASYDDTSDELTISNTPPSVSLPKVTDTGIAAGTISIDFGDNGVFTTAFDPSTQSIADFAGAINTYGAGFGGNVTATFDTTTDLLTINNTAAADNQIVFDAGAESDALRQFFKLNNLASTGGGTQSSLSTADIDNSTSNALLDITNSSAETFDQLITPIALPQDNRIVFGGANGTAIANFFKLGNAANNGTGALQSIASSAPIDNGSLDASLELTAIDRTSTSLQALRTPKLNTLVAGQLRINSQNIININSNTNTIADVVDAINNFAPSGNRTYTASFDSAVAGGFRITINDTETLANAGSQPAANPGAASATLTANQLTLDSAAYFATGAPVFEQSTYSASSLTPNGQNTPYITSNPTAPGNISAISFSGTTNIASVLFLANASSGASSVVGDEFRGTATATSHNTYTLTGEQRRTFEASSNTTSSQRLGYDTSAIDEDSIPADGIIGEVQIIPRVAPRSEDQSLGLQVNGDSGAYQIRLNIEDLSSIDLRLEGLNLYRDGDSDLQARLRGSNALKVIDEAIETTLDTINEVGASQRILENNLDGLNQNQVNLTSYLSDLQDADVSEEIEALTQAQINIQVSTALLAQNRSNTSSLYSILFGIGGGGL